MTTATTHDRFLPNLTMAFTAIDVDQDIDTVQYVSILSSEPCCLWSNRLSGEVTRGADPVNGRFALPEHPEHPPGSEATRWMVTQSGVWMGWSAPHGGILVG